MTQCQVGYEIETNDPSIHQTFGKIIERHGLEATGDFIDGEHDKMWAAIKELSQLEGVSMSAPSSMVGDEMCIIGPDGKIMTDEEYDKMGA